MKTAITLIGIFISTFSWSQELQEEGVEFMNQQEYAKALDIFTKCAELDTTNLYCMEQAGIAASRMGSMSIAKKHFHALEKDPNYFKTACINLASIYEQQENVPRAIKYNTILRDSFPDNSVYHRKIGKLKMRANLPLEALINYAKALELNPSDVVTIRGMAELMLVLNKPEVADTLLHQGLSIDSTNVGLSLLLGRTYYKMKKYDSTAVTLLALRGRIDFDNYYNKVLGYSLLQIDSLDQAIFYLEKSLVNEGDPEYAHYYLASAYEKKEDILAAQFHLGKAIENGISQGTSIYYRNKARLHKDNGELKEAIKAYEWAYRLKNDPVLLFYLARASDEYYKDKSIAIRYYNQYVKSNHNESNYQEYAKDRMRYLKELKHFQSSNN